MTTNITVATPHHALQGCLATLRGEGSLAQGIVVIHDAFGLTPVAVGHADSLASEGFVKEYPDAYHSFMGDHQTLVPKMFGKLLALRFNEKDAGDARNRISAFFNRHLNNAPAK